MNEYKKELLDTLNMLSDVNRQKKYYAETKIVDIPSDLICGWFDTGFFINDDNFKSNFTPDEWSILLDFNNYFDARVDSLPKDFEHLINDQNWLKVVSKAKDSLLRLNW